MNTYIIKHPILITSAVEKVREEYMSLPALEEGEPTSEAAHKAFHEKWAALREVRKSVSLCHRCAGCILITELLLHRRVHACANG